jgi:hypothetical protein
LLRTLPQDRIQQNARLLFGRDARPDNTLPLPCWICDPNRRGTDAAEERHPLADLLTTATASQVLNAFIHVTSASDDMGDLAAAAMSASKDYNGFVRYLPRGPWLHHVSVFTGITREEILIVNKGLISNWAVVGLYTSHLPARVHADALPNRLFADIGWRLQCYFNALPPLTALSLPGSSTGVRPSWFWFVQQNPWP